MIVLNPFHHTGGVTLVITEWLRCAPAPFDEAPPIPDTEWCGCELGGVSGFWVGCYVLIASHSFSMGTLKSPQIEYPIKKTALMLRKWVITWICNKLFNTLICYRSSATGDKKAIFCQNKPFKKSTIKCHLSKGGK